MGHAPLHPRTAAALSVLIFLSRGANVIKALGIAGIVIAAILLMEAARWYFEPPNHRQHGQISLTTNNGYGERVKITSSGDITSVVQTARTAIAILDHSPGPQPPLPPDPTPGPIPTPGPAPQPPVPPTPNPAPNPPAPSPPSPPVPPVPAGLAADVASWVQLVSSPDRVAEARKLGTLFHAVSKSVPGTLGIKLGSPVPMLLSVQKQVKESLGTSLAAWAPFQGPFFARINADYKAGKLNGNDAWKIAFEEVALGFDAAAAK